MLTGMDLLGWLALRRVHRGGVTELGGCYLDQGHPVPDYLHKALDALASAGLVTLGRPEVDTDGLRRVGLSSQGENRYTLLGTRAIRGTR